MSGYLRYPAYKDSSIEWLGEVPEHWDFHRAKYIFRQMQRPVEQSDEVVTAFRDGTVTLRRNRREDGFTNAVLEIGYQGVRTGDLVIHAMDAFAGAVGVSDSDGKCSPVYAVCTATHNQVSPRFYARLIRHMALTGYITSLARGIRERSTDFRYRDFATLVLPVPPIEEQNAINAFLDRETAKIDATIARYERLIALLREKRQALISHTVTKGLDPDAPMKDSGVEWLGEIPSHWDLCGTRRLFKIVHGATPRSDEAGYWDGDIVWVTPEDVGKAPGPIICSSRRMITEAGFQSCGTSVVPVGSVVLTTRAPIGNLVLAGVPLCTNQGCKSLLQSCRTCIGRTGRHCLIPRP